MDIFEQVRWGHGGRAEGGVCGALHAALRLSGKKETKEFLRREFVEKAGSEHCREIRRLKKLNCDRCVELAAKVLTEQEHKENAS